jgi:hypothetical protein
LIYFCAALKACPELDKTTSHSTKLAKDASQVAGYVEGGGL